MLDASVIVSILGFGLVYPTQWGVDCLTWGGVGGEEEHSGWSLEDG